MSPNEPSVSAGQKTGMSFCIQRDSACALMRNTFLAVFVKEHGL